MTTRFLVLDDDPLILQTITEILKTSGIEVMATSSATEFFELLDNWKPQYVATDLLMPDVDGIDVIKQLSSIKSDTQLIILSGVETGILEAAERTAIENRLALVGVLSKPFTPSELRTMLTKTAWISEDKDSKPYSPVISISDLEIGLLGNELNFECQPKINCSSGLIDGFEVLARWNHAEHGFIPPDAFITLAEENGYIDALTLKLTTSALKWFAMFRQTLLNDYATLFSDRVHLAINISAQLLTKPELFESIEKQCLKLDIPLHRIVLEISETSIMEDYQSALRFITNLRLKGFQLAIDDFGTGYSSLLQLVRLPFSELKIDKSFVLTATESAESRTVIKAIIDLGHQLGLSVTAEGIENDSTLELIRYLGSDNAQGFGLARPMSTDAIPAWLDTVDIRFKSSRPEILNKYDLAPSPEHRFDRITHLAQRIFNAPSVRLGFTDDQILFLKSRVGDGDDRIPIESSICQYTVKSKQLNIIPDTLNAEPYRSMTCVTEGSRIRFYAGYPVKSPEGTIVGSLSITDDKPREFTDRDARILESFGKLVEHELSFSVIKQVDPITQLLNRSSFMEYSKKLFDLFHELEQPIAILTFNLHPKSSDGMVSEMIALHFAQVLHRTLRRADILSRYSNRDFAILISDQVHNDPMLIVNRLVRALTESTQKEFTLPQFSCGYTRSSDHDRNDLSQLIALSEQQVLYSG